MIEFAKFKTNVGFILVPTSSPFVIHHFTTDLVGRVKDIALFNFDKTNDNRYIFILFTEYNIKEILRCFRKDIIDFLRALNRHIRDVDIEMSSNFVESFLPYLTDTEKLYIEL